jgi:hypothetical protein
MASQERRYFNNPYQPLPEFSEPPDRVCLKAAAQALKVI